ncbi:sugar kinase [Enterococcus sp.]|jgi:2-dehydro-3-deoxygluconokinase|uniref:sugar kinase n=1 Tax=Enterococcus sp. TaxID=35783 RepID=UPI0025BC1837|nr:sugar kinase [Enterococcus sp.]
MANILTLGEIMLRLSTPVGERIAHSSAFAAHYGGGEANVAISLANFGHQVSFASKVPENALGDAVLHHLRSYGVDCRHLLRGGSRLGTYYIETGVGERAARVVYDRAGSSFAQMADNEWSEELFDGVDIFHLSGITPALSSTWRKLLVTLIKEAKAAGCKISFDINYRGKLWSTDEARVYLQEVLPYVDYCSAGKLDAQVFMDIPAAEKEEADDSYYYQEMHRKYPNIKLFYATNRQVFSASHNQLTGSLWHEGNYVVSATHEIHPIVDRVGGGDAFSAGILHGLLTNKADQAIIDFATAASALKHTIHGDCNQFTEAEVTEFLAVGSGKIIR